ncbi:MAG: type I pullulanase [Oscillospiraceae bacterium]|jgi:type I pullulanase|nr:type I pullulanase [Oscillospiraceae bacterium]
MKRIKKIFSLLMVVLLMALIAPPAASAAKDYAKFADTLDKTTYTKADLGATYSKKSTTFKVWSPTAKLIKLRLYTTGSDAEKGAKIISEHNMGFDDTTGVWFVTLKGDYKNKYYTYMVYSDTEVKETVDIYAKAVGVNGNRGMVVDLATTNPEGWAEDKNVLAQKPGDAIIWEVQIKDFSYSPTSGVSDKNRGKYLAFTESGTTIDGIEGNPSTCVDYLKKLGVTHVQINPFYDFASIDESGSDAQYNWGYDPKNYNTPDGSFSSNPYDGNVRINECKQMIQALHNAGIGVIMDVVYNHTYDNKNSWFNRTVPDYYYRIKSDGKWSDGSACGNDTASERAMFRKFMIDSVTFWAKEYHIDGFRFDLMGLHDVDTMNQIRAALDKFENGDKILMYGEAWRLDTHPDPDTVLATQGNMSKLSNRIAAFNDGIRDAIKGSTFDLLGQGFIQGNNERYKLQTGIPGQLSNKLGGWAKDESQTITYNSCHDNNTLYDKLVMSVLGNDGDFKERNEQLTQMNKLAGAIILTSRGAPFMLAGEEFCRTKEGDSNSYASSPTVNEINWENINTYSDVYEYYRGLIKLRKLLNNPVEQDNYNHQSVDVKFFENVPKSVVAFKAALTPNIAAVPYEGKITFANEQQENQIEYYSIFNQHPQDAVEVTLEFAGGTDTFEIVANNITSGVVSLGTVKVGETVTVQPSSAVVLVQQSALQHAAEDEGKVAIEYFDNSTGELVQSQVLSGKVGTTGKINVPDSIRLGYDLPGDFPTEINFTKETQTIDIKLKKYSGVISTVTFKFEDADDKAVIAPAVELSNRQGTSYALPELPGVADYSLDLSTLDGKLAGKFTADNQTIEIFYKKAEQSSDNTPAVCTANIIVADRSGKIISTRTFSGALGEDFSYTLSQASVDELDIGSSYEPIEGKLGQTEQNYLIYSGGNGSEVLFWWLFGLAVAVIAGGGIAAYFLIKKRKANEKNSMIIDEEEEEITF